MRSPINTQILRAKRISTIQSLQSLWAFVKRKIRESVKNEKNENTASFFLRFIFPSRVVKIILFLNCSIFLFIEQAECRVRRVPVNGDQIVTVRTSIGIATIIQVPDRPNSVVVGDQDSFKVEYLDQAITIKPLSGIAMSNLYIYTDWKRYNVELVSGSETVADYVVYLENPKEKPQTVTNKESGIKWTEFKNSLRSDSFSLSVKRLGRTKDGILLVEFHVTSSKKEVFKPDWLWLTQNGETKPIHNLFMSALEVASQKGISGVLQIREIDLNLNEPIRIELRRNRISYLTIQKASLWKR